jgi:hypothetical protein
MINDLYSIVFLQAVLFSICYGALEAWIYDHGYEGGFYIHKKIKISQYHIRAVILFVIAFYDSWWLLPLMAPIQDSSFYAFSKEELDHKDWVNFKFGGNKIGKIWIPNTYIIYILIFFAIQWSRYEF